MRHLKAPVVALCLIAGVACGVQAQEADTRNILVFGDSLSWGWTPSDPVTPSKRYPPEERWTSVMAENLGEGYDIVVEGLSGRTTNIDDPSDPKLNGADYLPSALASHEPLDLVIILLGTNDTKAYLDHTPLEIGLGAGELINIVHEAPGWDWTEYETPAVLLVSPPPLGESIAEGAAEAFAGGREKSLEVPAMYEAVAGMAGEHFFDAGSVIETDGIDGIHLTAEANEKLGAAVAEEVRTILE